MRRTLGRVLARYPEWAGYASLNRGELEVEVPAPQGAEAGHLVIVTNAGDRWVRFDPPRTMYFAESDDELIEIVDGLVSERLCFVVTCRDEDWVETTLTRSGGTPDARSGHAMRLFSWGGTHDRVIGQ